MRWKIRGPRLLLVDGPYENERIIMGPFTLTMAIQQACHMLEAIDRLAVTTNTESVPLPDPAVCIHEWHGLRCARCGHEWHGLRCARCGKASCRC